VTLLVLHVAVTWFMVGLIWVIQTVHYPLFAHVGAAGFDAYEQEHTRRMGLLLVVPAGLEVITAAVLVWVRPEGVGLPLVLAAGALLAAIWIMTALVQAPLHGRLSSGYDDVRIARLIASNWWRTAAWSVRGVLVAAML
jgi:hypothetical protein